jgi:hypothetical protein
LERNQFARLPENSTFEPIRILNEIIQDANKNEKELWIVFLDMSKAYDRVNVFMLEKVMLRLKLPWSFINIIKSLFLERKNQVFMAKGLTDLYDMLVGIRDVKGSRFMNLNWRFQTWFEENSVPFLELHMN